MGWALRKDVWRGWDKRVDAKAGRMWQMQSQDQSQPCLELGQTLLESSFWFQWCYGVVVMWSGRVRIGLFAEQALLSRLPYLWILKSQDSYSSNFIWVTTKQRHFLYFSSPHVSLSIQSTNGIIASWFGLLLIRTHSFPPGFIFYRLILYNKTCLKLSVLAVFSLQASRFHTCD